MVLSTADWLDKQAKSKNHRLDVMPYRTGEVAVLLGSNPYHKCLSQNYLF